MKRSKGHFDSQMKLSKPALNDLNWWIISLPTAYRTTNHANPHVIIRTDASRIGCEAVANNSTTQGLWAAVEGSLHINCLELLAIQFGLVSLFNNSHDWNN